MQYLYHQPYHYTIPKGLKVTYSAPKRVLLASNSGERTSSSIESGNATAAGLRTQSIQPHRLDHKALNLKTKQQGILATALQSDQISCRLMRRKESVGLTTTAAEEGLWTTYVPGRSHHLRSSCSAIFKHTQCCYTLNPKP